MFMNGKQENVTSDFGKFGCFCLAMGANRDAKGDVKGIQHPVKVFLARRRPTLRAGYGRSYRADGDKVA